MPGGLLPNGVFLQQPLNWDREFSQEALDNRPTLGKLILDLNLQDIGGKRHETEALVSWNRRQHRAKMRIGDGVADKRQLVAIFSAGALQDAGGHHEPRASPEPSADDGAVRRPCTVPLH